MVCNNCGKEVVANAKFCPHCGKEVLNSNLNQENLNNKENVNNQEVIVEKQGVYQNNINTQEGYSNQQNNNQNIEEKANIGLAILSFFIPLAGLIIFIVKKDKEPKKVPGQELVLTEKLVVPNGPELPRDYNTSRQTKDKWTDQESQQWFTIPGDKEIEALSKSNDNLINEIIGAAP